jgi:hypothetical protein
MLSEILNYIKKNREASASEIAVILKLDRKITEEALTELVNKGRIERNVIKHVSCGGCGGACTSSSCDDKEVFRYKDSNGKNKDQLAS